MSAELAHAAFARFAAALNRGRDADALRAAVTDDIEVQRHAPGGRDAPGPMVEAFAGFAEVERWILRMPPVITFSLAGAAQPAGGQWKIEYAYEIRNHASFRNGGVWVAALAGDGRITWLAHRPFALTASEPPAAAAR
ncbi:MAG TPA: hypothetical protein VFP84_27450 [Kofleriaceae bacterium]|nr:hypothetical protein [Kofleriaceae bacterium]